MASALVDCLLASMVLEDHELRCTSVAGHKLPVGSDFAATLLDDIGDSSVVVGLVTRSALASSWVLFELGATWGAKKNMKPLVTDEVDLKTLPGPVSGRHVARMSNPGDIAQFLEEAARLVGAKPRSAAKVNKAIQTLLSAHAQHVAAQSSPPRKDKIATKSKEPVFAGVQISSEPPPPPLLELSVTTAWSESDTLLVLILHNRSTAPLRDCTITIVSTQIWSETTKQFITYSHFPTSAFFKRIPILEPETPVGVAFIGKDPPTQLVLKTHNQNGYPWTVPLTKFGIYKFHIEFSVGLRLLQKEFFVNLQSTKNFHFTDDPRKTL